MIKALKALSALLTYPTPELQQTESLPSRARVRRASTRTALSPALATAEIAGGELGQQSVQLIAHAKRYRRFLFDSLADFARSLLQFGRWIGQQYGERFKGFHHHTTSIGVLARFGVPNRFASVVPPEQPLPNEKPQEPRRS